MNLSVRRLVQTRAELGVESYVPLVDSKLQRALFDQIRIALVFHIICW